jgi:hypothetical protein
VSDESLPQVILEDPVPASYRHAVRRRLQEHLAQQFRARQLSAGSVVFAFVLSHDGQLIDQPAITSPQGEPFIEAAKAALMAAQPFEPFPEGARAPEVRFRLAVEYSP